MTDTSEKWSIVADSDIHYFTNRYSSKASHVNLIINSKKTHNVEMVLVPGDVADMGTDGHGLFCFLNSNDEFGIFLEKFLNPIEKSGIPVKLGVGNHDTDRVFYPNLTMLKYIRDKHNATYSWLDVLSSSYYKFMHRGILFICLGMYPKNLNWLKKNLPTDKTQPVYLFFHFFVQDTTEDWWTNEERENFYNTIKDYNIIMIQNGHNHVTRKGTWKGIPCIISAGANAHLIEFTDTKITNITELK